jgi:hypothetical protein
VRFFIDIHPQARRDLARVLKNTIDTEKPLILAAFDQLIAELREDAHLKGSGYPESDAATRKFAVGALTVFYAVDSDAAYVEVRGFLRRLPKT